MASKKIPEDIKHTKAFTRTCFTKSLFWKFCRFNRKKHLGKSFFDEVARLQVATLLQKHSDEAVFLWILQILKKNLFAEHLWGDFLWTKHFRSITEIYMDF